MKSLYLFVAVFCCIQSVVSQEIPAPYNFRIKPGTESWRKLETHDEMIKVCRIPNDTLKRLTTAALLETSLSYPLMMDFLASNNIKSGFDNTYKAFNGYQELMNRPDFASTLIRYYQSLDIARVNTIPTLADKGYYSNKVCVVELFFGTSGFVNSLGAANRKQLVALLLDKLSAKTKHADVYGFTGQVSAVYAMANVMAVSESKQEILKKEGLNAFKTQLIFKDGTVLNEIISLAKAFIL